LAAAAAGLFAFSLSFFRVEDLDWHWYIGVGRWIVENRDVPIAEPFSFTAAGDPYRAEHWLSELLFYLAHAAGGTALLVTLKAGLFTAMAVGLTLVGARKAGAAPAALVTALITLASVGQMHLRLLILAPAILLAQVILLERWRATGKGLWWQLPLACLWINLHGSGPLAVAVLGTYLVGEVTLRRDRRDTQRVGIALVGAGLATLLTPYGWGLWQEAWAHLATESHHENLREFGPLTTIPLWHRALLGLVLLLILAGLACGWRHASPGLVITCAALFVLALGARRHLSLFLWPSGLLALQLWGTTSRRTLRISSAGTPRSWAAVTAVVTLLVRAAASCPRRRSP
jgi:hypothetical protein